MPGDVKTLTNQLAHVDDAENGASYTEDIDDQDPGNYDYDNIGNLIKDSRDSITNISWTVYGKIRQIEKMGGVTIHYSYDAAGNRVVKEVSGAPGGDSREFYIRDAQGNTLALYRDRTTYLDWSEQHLYGSSRLGIWHYGKAVPAAPAAVLQDSLSIGSTAYELTNHLGNVLSSISDKKIGVSSNSSTVDYYAAEVLSQNDYYPFGMGMPGRKFSNGLLYRYGFNGQEMSNEIKGVGNSYTAEFWEMDPRIGRRWNLDSKFIAGENRYAVNGNNPIIYIDPYGDFKTKFGAWLFKQVHGGKISRDAKSGQYFVGKRVEYEGEGAGIAYQRSFDWNGGSRPYTGSGWGHTSRSFLANIFGVNGKASTLFDLGWNSVLQNSSVLLTGDLLNKVKQDPDVIRYENWIVKQLQGKGEGMYSFESNQIPSEEGGGIQLGGDRGSLNPLDPSSIKTWKVAANPLTWAVRSVNIHALVRVSGEGCMNITYSFTDNFDLRPERGGKVYFGGSGNSPFSSGGGKRPWQYNAATSVLGVPYHDIVGGNDQLKINATWQSNR